MLLSERLHFSNNPEDQMELKKYFLQKFSPKFYCLFLCLFLTGCNFLGPKILPQDRMGYNDALKNTEDEQILLNLVRMQYGDRPYFVGVASITASTSFARGLSLNGTRATTKQSFLTPFPSNPSGILFQSGTLSPNISYAETPTITYTPLQGSTFTRQMLLPVSLEKISLLIHSGWSPARVLRLTTQSIGVLKNAPDSTRPGVSHIPEYKSFVRFSHLVRTLEREGIVNTHVVPKAKDEPFTIEVALIKHTPKGRQHMQELLTLLGFKKWHDKFRIIESDRGTVDDATESVTIQTRSYLGILYYLSKSVEVPQRDIERGFVVIPRTPNGQYFDWQKVTEGMMRIKYSLQRPSNDNINVIVFYRGMWFYIEDSDSNSKETLSLLEQLFSLQAGNLAGNPPTLTLPI